ncbi:MAG: hypothetical protein N3A58_05045 [Spirochaetes bacterium]|nr:hypothetical protein [Spirochaetota bacterium]
MQKKKILMLYVLAGEGHLAICKSIRDALNTYYINEFDIRIEDAIPPKNKLLKFISEDTYQFLSSYATPIYGFIYYFSHLNLINNINVSMISKQLKNYISELIKEFNPNLIIVSHPLIIQAVYEACKLVNLNIPIINTVLDLKPGPWYFNNKNVISMVPNNEIKELAIKKYKIPETNIVVIPPPLKKGFYEVWSKEERKIHKEKLGFRGDKKLVLLAGGGVGLPYGEFVFKEILKIDADIDIALVCGRNNILKKIAEKLYKIFNKIPERVVKIYGFIDFMPELMHCSELVITKAGYSGIFEALTLRKPLIISYYILGQESGNAEFIKKHKVGYIIKSAKKIAQKTKEILTNENLELMLRENIIKLNLENGYEKIANLVKKLIENKI